MNKTKLLVMTTMMAMLPFSSVRVNADPLNVPLQVGYEDPTGNQINPHKSPVLIPEVSIEDYTLYLDDSCAGCTLRLLDENGDVAYTTVIPDGIDEISLPSTLSGDYELQIVRGNWCFYGYINL